MDTGLKRLLLNLLWRYVAESGLEPPLTIIVSFDIGKQLSFRGYPRRKTGLVEECGFQHFKAAFDGRNFVLLATLMSLRYFAAVSWLPRIRMVDQAIMWLLFLDGHRQGGD